MSKKRVIPPLNVRRALAAGCSHPSGLCSLPRPLSGAPRRTLLLYLNRHDLVRVTAWEDHGPACRSGAVIGEITDKGRAVYHRGYL